MDHETCHTTHLKILGLVTSFDLTLTLAWAKCENSTRPVPSPGPWEYSWKVWGENANFVVSTVQNLNTPDFDLWLDLNWHVISILNFRNCFRCVSSRSFECLLARLSTTIHFRDSMWPWGRIRPPGGVGYRNSPGGSGKGRPFCSDCSKKAQPFTGQVIQYQQKPSSRCCRLEPLMEWVTRMDMDMEWISGGYGYFFVKSFGVEWVMG